ncbi:SGNH/GDSL hydrolase family protein [Variovorax sp. KK3]|uniref:SGNH/GDSL hydrolase family protein n=1 Tax=Variovorax sp. KK3 TaxID=1855728 RepID=UPI00097BC679|nr:SGNH/GDSL hydrolase family protein [Variovorax sp. KK3]
MKRGVRLAAGALALAVAAGALTLGLWSDGMPNDNFPPSTAAPGSIPLAVLGDSNSHSYQDHAWFPAGGGERGGPLRSRTFQWTEVLAKLRGQQVDLGPWVRWGRPGVVALAREWMGLPGGRAPLKEDYLYNFANSGASCKNLMDGRFRQAPRLVALMDQDPERWKRGAVVIRIGFNDWGGSVDLQASDPTAAPLREATARCAGDIGAAVALIRRTHPSTRIMLVGIGNEADDPANFERWASADATRNIDTALGGFNGAIRRLAEGDAQVAYFDDLAWFRSKWGTRAADGRPDYKAVELGPSLRVANAIGDDPRNSFLEDRHPGLVFNAMWAQSLVARLRDDFGLPLTPIGDEELLGFLGPLVTAAPPSGSAKAPGS